MELYKPEDVELMQEIKNELKELWASRHPAVLPWNTDRQIAPNILVRANREATTTHEDFTSLVNDLVNTMASSRGYTITKYDRELLSDITQPTLDSQKTLIVRFDICTKYTFPTPPSKSWAQLVAE